MKKLQLLFIAPVALSSVVHAQSTPPRTTVFIVRHGEKDMSDPKNPDPQLSAHGREMAICLAGFIFKVDNTKYTSLTTWNRTKPHHTSVIKQ